MKWKVKKKDFSSNKEYSPLEVSKSVEITQLIPQKSARRYEIAYNDFQTCSTENKMKEIFEYSLF